MFWWFSELYVPKTTILKSSNSIFHLFGRKRSNRTFALYSIKVFRNRIYIISYSKFFFQFYIFFWFWVGVFFSVYWTSLPSLLRNDFSKAMIRHCYQMLNNTFKYVMAAPTKFLPDLGNSGFLKMYSLYLYFLNQNLKIYVIYKR